jgi:hypothetical protein
MCPLPIDNMYGVEVEISVRFKLWVDLLFMTCSCLCYIPLLLLCCSAALVVAFAMCPALDLGRREGGAAPPHVRDGLQRPHDHCSQEQL